MLNQLKFAQGAVKKNTISPELEYYQIKGGRVIGYNGYIALSAPIDLDIEAKPKADLFYKALDACGESISIAMTAAGRLHIRSGKFSAFVPCIDKEVYEASPQGDMYECPPGMAQAFKKMLPFISEDASRPWAMGLLVDRGCLTATNNIVVIQEWVGHTLPTFNCPRFAVTEIARVGKDPVTVQVAKDSVTFHYADGSWLRTQLLAAEWPIDKLNEIMSAETAPIAVPTDFFDGISKIAPFVSEGHHNGVYFKDGGLATAGEGSQEGATIQIDGLPDGPVFNIKALRMLEDVVEKIDFTLYPRPCIFFGKNIRGAIMGMQV